MPELMRQRHALVWLAAGGPSAARPKTGCSPANPRATAWLTEWVSAKRPLVVARQEGVSPGMIRLGLPLPPAQGKLRLRFDLPTAHVIRSAPPPRLAMVGNALPDIWHRKLGALLASPEIIACAPRVFGSVAMQALTGLVYVTESSDLDIALTPSDWASARATIEVLSCIDAGEGLPRIDGEIIDPLGHAVCWREVAGDTDKLLSKHLDGAKLLDRSAFIDAFSHANNRRRVA